MKAAKPQYVLIAKNDNVRTSNITSGKIMKAVFEIGEEDYVVLERCIPLTIIQRAKAYSMSYYSSGVFCVHFTVDSTIMRMAKNNVGREEAADIMCDFFQSAKLPNMDGWICEEFCPPPPEHAAGLSVDGQDFEYFGSADVMAALENIIEGKSDSMLFDAVGDPCGYISISRAATAPESVKFKVEYVQWTNPEPIGRRAVVADASRLRSWLWALVDSNKYPDPAPDWTSFDVNDYFQRLISKYSDNDER